MKRCNCGSYAINIEKGELEDDNCDVCHYKNKVTQVASEAYQVIGALASDLPHSKEVIRALDYFSAISCGENPSGEMLPFLCDWEQQSPAVAVPCNLDLKFIEECLISYKSGLYFDGAEGLRNKIDNEILSINPTSHRITEKDAREMYKIIRDIVQNYECGDEVDSKLRPLLNKLNARGG